MICGQMRCRPSLWLTVVLLALLAGPTLLVGQARAAPFPQATDTPKLTPVTEGPAESPSPEPTVAPTIVPMSPTPLLELPTLAPSSTPTRREEEAPAPQPTEPLWTLGPPTRTRRPTRTPRWPGTAEPTALAMGAMRLEVALDPPAPEPGQLFRVLVDMANRAPLPLEQLTLDVAVSSQVRLERASASLGDAVVVDAITRWYVPLLPAAGRGRLTLEAVVMPAAARQVEVCVLVLSAGAPLEHCSVFGLGVGSAPDRSVGPTGQAVLEEGNALPTAVPAGILADVGGGPVLFGWLLVLVGLVGIGVWAGMQWRGRSSDGVASIHEDTK